MQLLNPYGLWVLGFIPLLIVIHNLRSRRKQIVVTNFFLWQAAVKERNKGFRIRSFILKNLSLILLILMVILSALALARPVLLYTDRNQGDVILVLDTSASMKTFTEAGTRFDKARETAIDWVNDLPEGSKMLIMETGAMPIIQSRFSSDKTKLKTTIGQMEPTDAPGRLKKALFLALSFVKPEKDDRILVITDGGESSLKDMMQIHSKITPVIIGGGQNNVGIIQFEFRQETDRENSYEIMLAIRNFNPHPVLCPITLSLDDTTIVEKTIGLKALEKRVLIIPYSGLIAGRAEASIKVDDDFPIDNTAYSVLSTTQDIWVLLVSHGNYFLEKLLSAYPNILLNTISEIDPTSWSRQVQEHDIVIIDRVSFPWAEEGNFLIIDAFSPDVPIVSEGQVENPEIVYWKQKNPLMTHLNFRGLRIARASKVKVDKSVTPLLESQDTGLIFSYEKEGVRAVFLGFDLGQSNLPLKVAFPVFMSNMIHWLHPHKLKFSSAQVKAGYPFPIHLDTKTKTFSILTPSGQREAYMAGANPFLYKNTRQAGLYRIIEGEMRRQFAVNLTDESESNIQMTKTDTVRVAPRQNDFKNESQAEWVLKERPLWFFFLIMVLVTLLLEGYSWLRERRSV